MKTTTSTWALWLGIFGYFLNDILIGLVPISAIIVSIIAISKGEHKISAKAYWGLGLGLLGLTLSIFLE